MSQPNRFDEVIATEMKRVSALRMQMLENHPFWGYLLLQLKILPTPNLGAIAATDCIRKIWFDPLITQHMNASQLGFVLAHEVGHQVFASLQRQAGRAHRPWNQATDYAINRMVAEMSHPTRYKDHMYQSPNGHYPGIGEVKILHDPKYDNMIAETIYEHLLANNPPSSTTVTLTFSASDQQSDVPHEGTVQDHDGGIDVHLPNNLSPAEREELLDRIGAAVEWWNNHKQTGNIPGGIARRFTTNLPPRVPWQRLLHRFVNQTTDRDEYTLARPNRRYLAEELVVPGIYGEATELIVVAIDTSGSMSKEELNQVAAELAEAAQHVNEITVLIADAKVHTAITMEELPAFLANREFKGGGGTDHRPVFAWLEEQRLQPQLFVGLTDLYSSFPENPPKYPVLWVTTSDHGEAPWGRTITLP